MGGKGKNYALNKSNNIRDYSSGKHLSWHFQWLLPEVTGNSGVEWLPKTKLGLKTINICEHYLEWDPVCDAKY